MESDSLKPLATLEEIDQLWIEKMLAIKFGVPVVVHSWNSRVPSGREGFLSEIAFLKIVYSKGSEDKKDLQLVLKVLPKDDEIKKFMANGELAKREVEFYKFVSTQEFQNICETSGIDLLVPEIYFSCYAKDAISIVLKDLSVDKCKGIIVKEGSTLSQTKVALSSVSQVHAAGLIYLKKYGDRDENLAVLMSEFSTDFYDQFIESNLQRIIEMTKGSLVTEKLKSLIPVRMLMFTYHKRYPLLKTVVHGDLWAGQMLYTDDKTRAYTIDWQFCRVDNPVLDIVCMFFMSGNPEMLDKHMDELLICYWQALNKPIQSLGLSLDVTFEQFKENVEDLLMFGFAILAVSIHDFLGAGNVTEERIVGAVNFVEKRGGFSKFLNMIGSGV